MIHRQAFQHVDHIQDLKIISDLNTSSQYVAVLYCFLRRAVHLFALGRKEKVESLSLSIS